LRIFLNLTANSLFFLGFFLFIINTIGLFISLRNDSIYQEKNITFANDIILTEKEFYNRINKAIIDRKEYITNLNEAVNQGIAKYWRNAGIDKYNLRIPFFENYLLFIASYLTPEEYLKYEFVDYRKAVERGVGLCSQQAIIVSEILLEKNIPSFIVGLSGHVVLRAQVDKSHDEWWVLDPDYGVVIPYDIDIIENNTKIIRPFYAQAGYDQKRINGLENIYEKEGNAIMSEQGARGYQIKKFSNEPIFYFLKWLIPCILMATPILFFSIRRLRRTKEQGRTKPTI
jgi:hypothetical protein